MILLTKLDTDLVDEAEVRQVFKLAVTVNSVADEAAFANIDILLARELFATRIRSFRQRESHIIRSELIVCIFPHFRRVLVFLKCCRNF